MKFYCISSQYFEIDCEENNLYALTIFSGKFQDLFMILIKNEQRRSARFSRASDQMDSWKLM